jgi:hypothetical protein
MAEISALLKISHEQAIGDLILEADPGNLNDMEWVGEYFEYFAVLIVGLIL